MKDEYYHIQLSKANFIVWIVISSLFTLATSFSGFIIFLIPLFVWLGLKKRDYYYNDEKMIVESGIILKKQDIIPLYRIININSTSILWIGSITIQDKGKTINLPYIKEPRKELLALTEKWEKAKKQNVRNEVI